MVLKDEPFLQVIPHPRPSKTHFPGQIHLIFQINCPVITDSVGSQQTDQENHPHLSRRKELIDKQNRNQVKDNPVLQLDLCLSHKYLLEVSLME
jgi:hypothetical protein